MSKRPIGLLTFDLWDCLFADDSDEAKRGAASRLSKSLERRQLVFEAVNREKGLHTIPQSAVNIAYDCVDGAFRKVWHEEHVTWTVAERVRLILQGLGRELDGPVFDELVHRHEQMELEFRPDPAPGAVEALATLAKKYPLVIVSDAIFSPGRALRELLEGAGMLQYFRHCVFSDEAGRSKPHRRVFELAAESVAAPIESIVHVGDRPHNDLGGPHAVGARGVLLTVVKERPLDGHKPDAVCSDYAELPAMITALDA